MILSIPAPGMSPEMGWQTTDYNVRTGIFQIKYIRTEMVSQV
jgi:hypothetical protein